MTENTSHEPKIQTKKISWTNVLLMLSIGVLLFGLGYSFGQSRGFMSKPPLSISGSNARSVGREDIDFSLFWEVWNKVEEKFVDEKKLDAKKMYYGAIKGMVASVEDPYTFFLTPDENKKSKDDLGGRFEGIGAQLGMKNNLIVIISPLKDSPAMKQGLRAGDIIIKVDGASTQGWTLNQTVGKIRGPGGTNVKLTINRDGKEMEFTIKRETIKVDSVELTYEKGGSIAVIKINQFGETTNSEWDSAAAEVAQKYQSGVVKGMILDLRDNPGGYLESSVYVASEFLPEGKLVVKQDSTIEGERDYTVTRKGDLLDIPMVTMVNGGSASAAEILSGALRDHKRTKLVGEKSFGKGSVQEALDLSQGAGLHVTVAKWILPNGDWIHGKGITPETQVKNEIKEGNTMTRDTDLQLNRALEELSK
jgi:carboxyl-terminal processing protease